jgi:hypothetical protein
MKIEANIVLIYFIFILFFLKKKTKKVLPIPAFVKRGTLDEFI